VLLNRNARKVFLAIAVLSAVLACNTVSFASTHLISLTGWELSSYEIPYGAEADGTGVEIIDSEEKAYDGRGALHIWSGGTKAKGYIPCAATNVEALEAEKTYCFKGMIKTSQTTYGRPALTVGSMDVSTSLASGLTANQWCEFSKNFVFSGSSKELKIQMWNTGDVYLDNISLKEVIGTDFGEELLQNTDFEKDYERVYKTPTAIKDDYENIIVGANAEMEYSVNGGTTWVQYDEKNIPHFSGDVTVFIRYSEDPNKDANILKLNFCDNEIVSGNFSISDFEIVKNEFAVKGAFKGAKNTNVNVMLVREGKSRRSLEDIILISSFETADDGTFSFTAPVADIRGANKNDGWYTMYLKAADSGISEFNKVYFASSDSRKSAVELIKAGSTSAYFESDNANYNIFKALGFALSEYEKQGVDKAKAIQIFENQAAALGDALNEDNASAEFAKAVFLSSTGKKNATTVYEILHKYGSEFPIKYGDSMTLADVLGDNDVMVWVSGYFAAKPAQTMAQAEKLFDEAYALYLINNSTYGKMAEVVEAQSGYLNLSGANYAEYMSLYHSGNTREITISKYIVSKSAKAPFAEASELMQAISEGVANSKGSSVGGGGGAGGGGGGGSISPSAGISSSSAVKPVISSVEYFDDLGSYSWAKDAVNTLFEKGIISGKGSRVFAPQDKVTRQEFVKMMVVLTDSYDETAECEFEDVDKNAWYYRYVASAVKKGLIFGISDTDFGTGECITREQIAVIADRILNKQGDGAQTVYADDDQVGEYAKEAVYNVRKLGIMSGYEDGTFGPQKSATRAEAAVICLNVLNKR